MTEQVTTDDSSIDSAASALSAGFGVFSIWRRGHFEDCWSRTSHSVTARTDKEAQAKVKRKFSGCGFSAMGLVAVRYGKTPNVEHNRRPQGVRVDGPVGPRSEE